jgi:hypothetical protein
VTEDEAIRADFRNFLFLVWQQLGLPQPTRLQYDIAAYLQHGPDRLIVQGYRGVGKTWITVAYAAWCLYCNPQAKILVVSASKVHADNFSIFLKRLINEMPLLHFLKTRPGQRDSVVMFDVGPADAAHAPSVKSVGITGQITGSRADIIIPDDIEVPSNSLTQLMRDRLSEQVKEFDAVLKPGGKIRYLGTPQTEMSLYGQLEERGYETRIWPARYPKAELRNRYGARLATVLVEDLERDPSLAESPHHNKYGKPADPLRFDEMDLQGREASYARSGFALQFMLDTSVSDGDRYPLKLADFIVMGCDTKMAPMRVAWGSGPDQVVNDIPSVGLAGDRLHRPVYMSPDFADFQRVIMAIDPSGRGNNETSYCVLKLLNGWVYLVEQGGFLDGYDKDTVLTPLARIAKKHGVHRTVIEANFGDGMFTSLYQPVVGLIHPHEIEEVKHSKQKEVRIIDTLEPVLNSHRLVVTPEVLNKDREVENPKYQLFYQLTRITREKGALAIDDRVDVLAIGVQDLQSYLNKDTEALAQRMEEDRKRKALEEFMQRVGMGAPQGPNWLDHM